jgi:membrane protein DedA with SNARE-associated domain
VRAFISVPAGIAEMKRGRFAVLTALGSAVWVAVIASMGYAAGRNWNHVSKDFHAAEIPIIILIVLVLVAGFWHRIRTVRRHNAS